MLRDSPLVMESSQTPVASTPSIGHGLQRRERLRRNDKQRLLRIEVTRSLYEVRAVDVGNEPEGQVTIAIGFQRLISHHGAQIGAADADVDDTTDPLPRIPCPCTN